MREIIKRLTQKPKALFLVDSLGAFVSASLLFVILRKFNEYIGMPPIALIYLSIIAVTFSLYSIICFFLFTDNWKPFLSIISFANVLYCCLTMGLVIYYYQSLTVLGIAYFIAEIIIITGLVFVEQRTLRIR